MEALKQSIQRQLTNEPDADTAFNFLKYRRDAKHKAKMFRMAQMYFQDKLKPRQIASRLNFANKFVRDNLYLIRKKLKQLKHIDDKLQSADDIPFEQLRFQIMEVIDPLPHHR